MISRVLRLESAAAALKNMMTLEVLLESALNTEDCVRAKALLEELDSHVSFSIARIFANVEAVAVEGGNWKKTTISVPVENMPEGTKATIAITEAIKSEPKPAITPPILGRENVGIEATEVGAQVNQTDSFFNYETDKFSCANGECVGKLTVRVNEALKAQKAPYRCHECGGVGSIELTDDQTQELISSGRRLPPNDGTVFRVRTGVGSGSKVLGGNAAADIRTAQPERLGVYQSRDQGIGSDVKPEVAPSAGEQPKKKPRGRPRKNPEASSAGADLAALLQGEEAPKDVIPESPDQLKMPFSAETQAEVAECVVNIPVQDPVSANVASLVDGILDYAPSPVLIEESVPEILDQISVWPRELLIKRWEDATSNNWNQDISDEQMRKDVADAMVGQVK